MSVVVVKVMKDKIVMAADTIAIYTQSWSVMPDSSRKITKLMKYNDMIIGSVGTAEESSLLFIYMKTHTINDVTCDGVLEFILEFKAWKQKKTNDMSFNNNYLLAFEGKCFCIEGLLVYEIDDWHAIGAGRDYANGALYMGADARTAVKCACDLCAAVSEPIVLEEIRR